MIRKPLAFLKKSLIIESSYKLSFLFNLATVLVSIFTYFFIDRLFGQKMVEQLKEYGVNYFSYVLLSMAFFSYVGIGLGSFAESIGNEQMEGTLEMIILTPTKIATLLFSLTLWNLIMATLDLSIYILLGIFMFKISFSNVNILSTLLILVLTIVSFSSLGIISASFALVFKRGNPFAWLLGNLEGLISGIYFPITILPAWLQSLAKFFPITYAIRAIQLAVYRGYSILELSQEICFLVFFCFLLLPLSLAFFKFALKKARKDGTLGQY